MEADLSLLVQSEELTVFRLANKKTGAWYDLFFHVYDLFIVDSKRDGFSRKAHGKTLQWFIRSRCEDELKNQLLHKKFFYKECVKGWEKVKKESPDVSEPVDQLLKRLEGLEEDGVLDRRTYEFVLWDEFMDLWFWNAEAEYGSLYDQKEVDEMVWIHAQFRALYSKGEF